MQNPSTPTETRSVLAVLRSLVPQRPLSADEALRIAELQANRLLRHFAVTTEIAPDEVITELPRIRLEYAHDLPVSGAAHWNGRYWVITLNADEHPFRQRYSLFHEFKHVLDHTTKDFLYHDRPGLTADAQAERVADYFAACALMSKRIVKRLWGEGHQHPAELSRRLQVSPAAARYRLDQLGLTERQRCQPLRRGYHRPRQGMQIA